MRPGAAITATARIHRRSTSHGTETWQCYFLTAAKRSLLAAITSDGMADNRPLWEQISRYGGAHGAVGGTGVALRGRTAMSKPRRIGVLTIGQAPKGFAGLRRYPFVTLST
jgi:hypothetical protein